MGPGIYEEPGVRYQLKILEDANGNPEYIGIALPGKSTSEEAWQIRKITYSATQGVSTVKFANGTQALTNIMDNAASYTYS